MEAAILNIWFPVPFDGVGVGFVEMPDPETDGTALEIIPIMSGDRVKGWPAHGFILTPL